MAEIVGTIASAVTLAALFKSCIEAFDIIRTAQNQALDFKKLTLKLNIEKCRLYTWGQAMGLTDADQPDKPKPLDLCTFPEIVEEVLRYILDLFKDSDKLKDKYGCKTVDNMDSTIDSLAEPQGSVMQQFNFSFDNFRIKPVSRSKQATTRLPRKVVWVVHDRNKFQHLIQEAKGLVDSLQDVTKDLGNLTVQENMVRSRILKISDVRTLDWVAEVCEQEHPAFSDAATWKAESISEASSFYAGIQGWKDKIDELYDDDSDASSVETTLAAMEDMTVTEIKHKFSTYLLKARDARLQAKTSENIGVAPLQNGLGPGSKSLLNALETQRRAIETERRAEEIRTNQAILEGMANVSADLDLRDEYDAVLAWFRVLSRHEQSYIFYRFGAMLNDQQARFFALVHSQRNSMPNSSTSVPLEPADEENPTREEAPVVTVVASPPIPSQPLEVAVKDAFHEFAVMQKDAVFAQITKQKQVEKDLVLNDLKDFAASFQLSKPKFGKPV